jgi:predicted dienelactone hydrolase
MPAWAVEPLPVGFERREFVDEARSNWQNTGHRPLSTVIWYPASAGAPLTVPQVGDPAWRPYFVQTEFAVEAPLSAQAPRYPLVLLSHGSTSVNVSLAWLGSYLAKHGYIAAAVNHHGNTGAEGQSALAGLHGAVGAGRGSERAAGQMLADRIRLAYRPEPSVRSRPLAGVATVIMLAGGQFSGDEMGSSATRQLPRCAGCGSRESIDKAIAELDKLRASDPAVQASLARAARSYRDERIRAVVAMAPAVGPGFTEATCAPSKLLSSSSPRRSTP